MKQTKCLQQHSFRIAVLRKKKVAHEGNATLTVQLCKNYEP